MFDNNYPEYFSVYYQTQNSRVFLAKLITTKIQNSIKVSLLCTNTIQLFGREIKITFNDTLIKQDENIEKNILSIVYNSLMEDKRINKQLVLIKQVPIPIKFIYFSNTICQKILLPQRDYKEIRGSSQTSNIINNLQEPSSQSQSLLFGNIQTSMFYGCDYRLIIKLLQHSNSSQKNKGDIAELVSFAFTCQKGPDGKYLRNFISTYKRQVDTTYDAKFGVYKKKYIDATLMYVPPVQITEKVKKQFNMFKQHEFYSMLIPSNDFVQQTKFAISSNIPAIDNSLVVQRINEKHLLIIARQDKIGYTDDQLVDMVTKGIINLCEIIHKWERYKNFEIDLIYTIARSRTTDKNKYKTLISPLANGNYYILLKDEVMNFVIKYFEGHHGKKITDQINISIFAENCLSDNIIEESAQIYADLAKEDEKYKENYLYVYSALQNLLKDKEFHSICDTTQYEIFLPAQKYINDTTQIEEYIGCIEMNCLRNRILVGLQIFNNLHKQQYESEPSNIEESMECKSPFNSDESLCFIDYDWR